MPLPSHRPSLPPPRRPATGQTAPGEARHPALPALPHSLRGAVLLAGLGILSSLQAELPTARLGQIHPAGGQAGTTLEVSVTGSDLDEPQRLHFSQSSIKATPKGEGARFTVTIESNTPPGTYDVRFVGRFGLSNPRAFVVGTLPELRPDPTNLSAMAALALPLDTTLNGFVQPNAVSFFHVSLRKGQRVLFECLARSLDSHLDPVLTLTDREGRELEHSRTGNPMDYTATADGTFVLRLSDFLYRGGEGYFYRLTASTGPRIDFIVPPSGLAGTKTNCVIFGRNLPGGKPVKAQTLDGKILEQLTVEITFPAGERARRLRTSLPIRPGQAAQDGFDYRLKTPKGTSNPFLMSLAAAPVVLEQEPNNKPAQAQKLTLPCEVAGQFSPGLDPDWYSFEARKGEVYWIEVFSQRLGLGTDPAVLVQRVSRREKPADLKGKEPAAEETKDVLELSDLDTNLGEREFNTASRDLAGRLEIKEDGLHRILVRDLLQRSERSPRFQYRLVVRPPAPDFRLAALTVIAKAKADAKNIEQGVPFLRRGETIALRVMAFRQHGFAGAIELSLETPVPGLVFRGDRIEAGKDSDYFLLSAREDAPAYAGPVRLVGTARVGDKDLVSDVRQGTLVFPVGNVESERPEARVAREFGLAISDKEPAPVIIAPAEDKVWEVMAGAKLKVPLAVKRQPEFGGTLKLKPLGPGATEGLKDFEVVDKATNVSLTLEPSVLKLGAGTYVFTLQTQAAGKYRNNPEAAGFAEASAKEAEKTTKELNEAATKAAQEQEAAVKSAQEAEKTAGAAREKLTAAQAALDANPADEALKEKRAGAAKAQEEAAAKAKAGTEAKAAAEKAKAGAEGKAREAKTRQETATARAKEATERAKQRDVTVLVHSAPIRVRILPEPPAPAATAAPAPAPADAKPQAKKQ